MDGKFLVVNAGSSSLKFTLYCENNQKEIINGIIEKIGKSDSFIELKQNGNKVRTDLVINNHTEGIKEMISQLLKTNSIESIDEIKGIGHRVLHGGELYSEPVLIDDEVLNNIANLTPLGPLHHPGEIAGIKALKEVLSDVPMVAVFDTAFHQTMSAEKYMYPVPYEWYEKYGVRKYGFHGTSHNYITEKMKELLSKDDVNLIICHIGSGASISAIEDGKCIDTTMGLTPLDGLMMGTRCGSIDPSIVEYICRMTSKSIDEVMSKLNNKSGLLGITGQNDLRDINKLIMSGDKKAKLGIDMYANSIVKYIAQYYFELNGEVDSIIFTAGGGENDINLRKTVLNKISKITGVILNETANDSIAKYKENKSGLITTNDSKIPVFVLPTNEEIMILKATEKVINNTKDKPKSLIKENK